METASNVCQREFCRRPITFSFLLTPGKREQVELATIVRLTGVPEFNRLCYQTVQPNSPFEEVVLDIQGVLINHNLPPYNKKDE